MFDITGIVVLVLSVVLFLVLLVAGMWVAVAMGIVGVIVLCQLGGTKFLDVTASTSWHSMNSFVLVAVPLFVLMGEFLSSGRLMERFYKGVSAWVGFLPGALVQSNIVAAAIFAALSGASSASAASLSRVVYPEQKALGYDTRLITGSLAAGGGLSILIPPSVPMIIYGSVLEQSVGKLFMAGVMPGVMMSGLFMVIIGIRVIVQPGLVPPYVYPSWRTRLGILPDFLPIVILILLVLGSIYGGVATPSEAGAIGAFCALLLALSYRSMSWVVLWNSLLNTARMSGMIFFLVTASTIVGAAAELTGVGGYLAGLATSLPVPHVFILLLIYALYTALGCLVPGLPMMLMTLPVIAPVITGLGYDLIWFGVVMVIMIEVGQLTPPVGLNLFIIQSVCGEPFDRVVKGAFPFFLAHVVVLGLITIFPQSVLWLPNTMTR